MTCIVGVARDGQVWIGGDSLAARGGFQQQLRRDEKVFRNGDFLIGFTSSFRMGQVLRYNLTVPRRHADEDVMRYMVVTFISAVRQCLKDAGFATTENGAEVGGNFLVGYQGRLFQVCGDYQVSETMSGYDACGCGEEFALGALHAVGLRLDPEDAINVALGAAEVHSAGVSRPFLVMELK